MKKAVQHFQFHFPKIQSLGAHQFDVRPIRESALLIERLCQLPVTVIRWQGGHRHPDVRAGGMDLEIEIPLDDARSTKDMEEVICAWTTDLHVQWQRIVDVGGEVL